MLQRPWHDLMIAPGAWRWRRAEVPPSRDEAPAPQDAAAYDDGKAGRLSGFCHLIGVRWCHAFGWGQPMECGASVTERPVLAWPRRHRQAKAAIFDRGGGAAVAEKLIKRRAGPIVRRA